MILYDPRTPCTRKQKFWLILTSFVCYSWLRDVFVTSGGRVWLRKSGLRVRHMECAKLRVRGIWACGGVREDV